MSRLPVWQFSLPNPEWRPRNHLSIRFISEPVCIIASTAVQRLRIESNNTRRMSEKNLSLSDGNGLDLARASDYAVLQEQRPVTRAIPSGRLTIQGDVFFHERLHTTNP